VDIVLVGEVAADEDLFDFKLGCICDVREDSSESDFLG
jgi:hypothetical protein